MGVFQNRNCVYFDRLIVKVCNLDVTNFHFCASWDEDRHLCEDAIYFADNASVSKPHMALVFIIGIQCRDKEWGEDQIISLIPSPSPSRRRESKVERLPFEIGRRYLLDILRDAVESGVLFTDERAASVVYKTAKLQCANVINPLCWRARIGNYVLSVVIVEVAVVHCVLT